VAVWTLRQLVTFLIGVENDRLAALWWLIALRGLRRGEATALDRDDLDSEARELTISRQLVALPGELYCGAAEEPRQHPDHRAGRGRHPQARRPGRPAGHRSAAAPVHRPALP
jgi:integrase